MIPWEENVELQSTATFQRPTVAKAEPGVGFLPEHQAPSYKIHSISTLFWMYVSGCKDAKQSWELKETL